MIEKNIQGELSMSLRMARKYLTPLCLSIQVDNDYDFDNDEYRHALGVYEQDSVFEDDTIIIGINDRNILRTVEELNMQYPWDAKDKLLRETVNTTVFHEMGHGLCNVIRDTLYNTDELDKSYEHNHKLFDDVLGNEEREVEDFAWCLYDNCTNGNKLDGIVRLYEENIIKGQHV